MNTITCQKKKDAGLLTPVYISNRSTPQPLVYKVNHDVGFQARLQCLPFYSTVQKSQLSSLSGREKH